MTGRRDRVNGMQRHAIHIISIAKGLLLLAAIAIFARSGTSDELIKSLENFLHAWPWSLYPAYWFTVTFAGLILVFPLTLAQDHLMRVAEGNHEEMPALFWLNGLMIEMFFGTTLGCLFSVSMRYSPTYWWLFVSIAWMAYHLLTPKIQSSLVVDEEVKKDSLSDLKEMLGPPLKESGIELKDVHAQIDEDIHEQESDVIFTYENGKAVVCIPSAWVHTWKPDEVVAVTLHKAWMTRSAARWNERLLNALNALFCFGGYAWLYPRFNESLNPGPIHSLINAPYLLGWLILSSFCFKVAAFAFYRKWMYEADSTVVRLMKSPQALIEAFERALKESPALVDYPRWAEVLLFHSPSMPRRIDRLKK